MADQKWAVVLVSGGLDSATVLAIAAEAGFSLAALTIDYGQRHQHELAAATRVCAAAGVRRHVVQKLDLRAFGGSALTSNLAVPKERSLETMGTHIPVTYVPARNTIFLSMALAWAETLEAFDIFAGMNAVDYSGYPDCRPEFIRGFENLAQLATKAGVEGRGRWRVHTPLIEYSKGEIIRQGISRGVDYALTHSCYDPDAVGRACGLCDSCRLRLQGFAEAGVPDPVAYLPRL